MGDSKARATKHTRLPTKALGLAAALIIKKEETKGIVEEETKQLVKYYTMKTDFASYVVDGTTKLCVA